MPPKSASPFWPDHPVPPEAFAGREKEIQRLLERGIVPAMHEHPGAVFIEAEYGLGKTSLAQYVQTAARTRYGVPGLYVSLGTAETPDELGRRILRALEEASSVDQEGFGARIADLLKDLLPDRIQLTFFGVSVDWHRLTSQDFAAVRDVQGMGGVLRRLLGLKTKNGQRSWPAMLLVLDEINGIAKMLWFAQWLKGFIDFVAIHRIPVFLVVCGTPQRRTELIHAYSSVGQVFDVLPLSPLDASQTRTVYARALASADMTGDAEAIDLMVTWSAGYPRIVQIIGDAAYWRDKDGHVSREDVRLALDDAVMEVGRRFVDHQIVDALHSKAYRGILAAMAGEAWQRGRLWGSPFYLRDLRAMMPDMPDYTVRRFISRLRALGAVVPDLEEGRGAFRFSHPMIEAYLSLMGQSLVTPPTVARRG
ncbi:MAG: hypothetical protein OWU84_11225 [Firmicutes bacterium]|nr:hypothetical protein [Bacillota bacterium]